VSCVSHRLKHSSLTPDVKVRICPISAFDGVEDATASVVAFSISRGALREAVATHADEGRQIVPGSPLAGEEVGKLAAALDGGPLDSEELIIARRPGTGEAIRERMEWLAAALTPDDIPQPVELLQARRNAVMRRDMLATLGYYTAEEMADMHGSTAKNRFALATRWTRDGRVFSVPLGNRSVFPAFQFDTHGQPYPVVSRALAALPRAEMSPWGVGLWFYANNAWLPGQARPAELIGGPEQELILGAAQRLSEPEPL
jgi:hypothetical protein